LPNKLAHFAIEAENVTRARAFYEAVFGWQFEPWGPPGFYRIHGAGTKGSLQQRVGPSVAGRKGFECSFAVDDLDHSSKLIEEAGGTLVGPRHEIPTVGILAQFYDTEGNVAVIIQYTKEASEEHGLPWSGSSA
jgi:predicted enzyme related to lactoylglutathione lyase